MPVVVPVFLLPGELWIHVGQAAPGFFPAHVRVVQGVEWEAKRTAVEQHLAVAMEVRMPSSALHRARRWDGTCSLADLSKDIAHYADIVTTGFFGRSGLVIGSLKNRNDPLFEPFVYERAKGQQTYWDCLLSEDQDPV